MKLLVNKIKSFLNKLIRLIELKQLNDQQPRLDVN